MIPQILCYAPSFVELLGPATSLLSNPTHDPPPAFR